MVFSRIAIASVFLLTVILVPVSIPASPTGGPRRTMVTISGAERPAEAAPVPRPAVPPLGLLDLYDAVRAAADAPAAEILAADPTFAQRLADGLCSTSLDDARPAAIAMLVRLGDADYRLDRVPDDRLLAVAREVIDAQGTAPAPLMRRLVDARTASKLGRPGLPALIQLLASADAAVRRAAFDEIVIVAKGVPVEAAAALAANVATDDFAREGLLAIGGPAAPSLEAQLDSTLNRAAAAYVLARLAPLTYASKIAPVAIRGLAANAVAGDARFGVMTLIAIGASIRADVRPLIAGDDDQAAACAIAVLARTGGATTDDLDAAAPALRRLALRDGDEPEAAIDALVALGSAGELLIRDLERDDHDRAVTLWKRCADPNRAAWIPAGRLPNLAKRTE